MVAPVYTNYPVDRVANSGTIGLGEYITATFVGINELLVIIFLKM